MQGILSKWTGLVESRCPLPRLQSEGLVCRAGVQFLEVGGCWVTHPPMQGHVGLLGNWLSTVVQRGLFDSGRCRTQKWIWTCVLAPSDQWGFPSLLNCPGVAAASRARSSMALMDMETIKTVKVHVNTGTSSPSPPLFLSEVQIRDTSEIQNVLIVFF